MQGVKFMVELRERGRDRKNQGKREKGRRKEGRETAREGRRRRNCRFQVSRHLKSTCFIKLQSQLLVSPGGATGLPGHQVSAKEPDGC